MESRSREWYLIALPSKAPVMRRHECVHLTVLAITHPSVPVQRELVELAVRSLEIADSPHMLCSPSVHM